MDFQLEKGGLNTGIEIEKVFLTEFFWLFFDLFVHYRTSISQEKVLSQVDMALAQENQIIQVQF